tara:strand:+ start:1541 stop:2485 length:945 start_codon:yes stop_codon:yes gene_type:complete
MGVKLLNTLLKNLNTGGINIIDLQQLQNKRIVVDASIYMFRFAATDNLLGNFYLLCSTLRHYDIHSLFIFDGPKRSEEKNETLLDRKKIKNIYKEEYKELSLKYKANPSNIIKRELYALRLKCATFSKKDLIAVKGLLSSYGIMYRDAEGESDKLCAALVLENKAFACLTEDTDLFVYGCPRVLKYISTSNHTVMLYKLDHILNSLNLTYDEFKDLCYVSGTDYNMPNAGTIFDNLKNFKIYKETERKKTFLEWLTTKELISNDQTSQITKIRDIYNINTNDVLKQLNYFVIRNKYVKYDKLKEQLSTVGFIFI